LIGIVVKFNSNEYQDILDFSDELSKEYIRSKIKISNIIQEGNLVSVRYKHVVIFRYLGNKRRKIIQRFSNESYFINKF
jgi:predicted SnoaL-like aldol condensation-catalyzing enzyme